MGPIWGQGGKIKLEKNRFMETKSILIRVYQEYQII